jgi:hypothetical protein
VSSTFRHKVEKDFGMMLKSAVYAGKTMSMAQFHEYRKKKEKEGAFTPKLHEEKDEEEELNSIPDTFNHQELTDKYFPLFITFEKFSKMLQGTFCISNHDLIIQKKLDADNIDPYIKKSSQKPSFINTADKNFVNYDTFRRRYWPSLDDYCKHKFDCELVYSEFSIIKVRNQYI